MPNLIILYIYTVLFAPMPFDPRLRVERLRVIQDRHRGRDGKISDVDVLALV